MAIRKPAKPLDLNGTGGPPSAPLAPSVYSPDIGFVQGAAEPRRGGYRYRPYYITGHTLIDGLPEYDVIATQGGGSNWSSRQPIAGETYKARNSWDDVTGGLHGYQNENVTAILPLPDGTPIKAYWSEFDDGTPILIFHERGEPVCG